MSPVTYTEISVSPSPRLTMASTLTQFTTCNICKGPLLMKVKEPLTDYLNPSPGRMCTYRSLGFAPSLLTMKLDRYK